LIPPCRLAERSKPARRSTFLHVARQFVEIEVLDDLVVAQSMSNKEGDDLELQTTAVDLALLPLSMSRALVSIDG